MAFKIVEVDSAAIEIERTSDEPDGESVFTTFGEARHAAIARCIPNRDEWARMIRNLRRMTLADVR